MNITDLNHDIGSVASFKDVTHKEIFKVWIFRAGNYVLWLIFFYAFAKILVWVWKSTFGQITI